MKLIDKDALVAEIERMLHETVNNTDGSPYYGGRAGAFTAILSFINTLETKEEILDEEGKTKLMKKCVHKAYKRGYDMGVLKTINEMNHNIKEVDLEKEIEKCLKHYRMVAVGRKDFAEIAKHFVEFGLKAQKGE